MTDKIYRITGTVINSETKKGIPDITVQAWDNEQFHKDEFLCSGVTKSDGSFELSFAWSQFKKLYKDRKPDIYFKVLNNNIQIHSTEKKTLWNVDKPETNITIAIDSELRYVVSGVVKTNKSMPVKGARIEAYHYALPSRIKLGETVSNNNGSFTVDYTDIKKGKLRNASIDLIVECHYDKKEKPKVSEFMINAPRQAIVSFALPNEVNRAPSEFENLIKEISPIVKPEKMGNLTEEDLSYLKSKLNVEISLLKRIGHAFTLAKKAGSIDASVFYCLIDDEGLKSLEDIVSRPKSVLADLIRKACDDGLIPFDHSKKIDDLVDEIKEIAVRLVLEDDKEEDTFSLNRLLRLRKGFSKAARTSFIRKYVLHEGDTRSFLEQLREDSEFSKDYDGIRDLFELADLTGRNMTLLKHVYVSIKDITELADWDRNKWMKVLKEVKLPIDGISGKKVKKETYAEELSDKFKKRFPMVDLVGSMTRSGVLKPGKDLKSFIEKNRDFDPGKTPVNDYLAVAGMLESFKQELAAIADAKKREKRRQEQQAFINELRGLQFAYTLAPEKNRIACAAALKSFEIERQAYRSPVNADGKTSIQTYTQKADSAVRIVSVNRADFIAQWKEIRSGQGEKNTALINDEAAEIYDRARYQVFRLMARALNASAAITAVVPAFTSKAVCTARSVAYRSSSEQIPTIADLTTLFGNANYCQCSHCRSIYGPAAYLAEIVRALNDISLTELFRRRPDIFLLHLDCVNTATKLPHIDLAIELLERLIITQPQIMTGSGLATPYWEEYVRLWDLQTTHAENELALRPEYELPYVYIWLSICAYPLTLPWDKWFDEAHCYLEYLGIPLYQLIEAFLPSSTDSLQSGYGNWRKSKLSSEYVVKALLKLSEPLYDLIAKPFAGPDAAKTYLHSEDDLLSLFQVGANGVGAVDTLGALMKKLGLWRGKGRGNDGSEEFRLARRILGSRYIQDSRPVSNVVIDIIFPEERPCDPSKATVRNLTKDTILRIVKFEHLRRALGWTPDELNLAIMVFSKLDLLAAASRLVLDDINERLLAQLSHVIRISRKVKNISIVEILSWWGNMDTGAGIRTIRPVYEGEEKDPVTISLYERIFLDKALYQIQPDAATERAERSFFELNARKTQLLYLENASVTTAVLKHRAIVSAALELDEKTLLELVRFVGNAYFNGIGEGLKLNLESLSALYRIVSLTRCLRLTIHEFILIHRLFGEELDPFKPVGAGGSIGTEITLLFIEAVEKIKQQPFSIRDLAYLWQHYTESDLEEENVHTQTQYYLDRLRQLLSQPLQDIAGDDTAVSDKAEYLRQQLLQIGQGVEFTDSIIHSIDSTDGTAPAYSRPVERMIMPFLTRDQRRTLNGLFADPSSVDDRYDTLIEYLRKPTAFMSMLGQSLSERFGLSPETVKTLVALILRREPLSQTSALRDFIDWANGTVEESVVLNHLWRLEKTAWMISEWGLTAKELLFFQMYGGVNFNALPVEGDPVNTPVIKELSAIADYIAVRGRISVNNGDIIDIFLKAQSPQDAAVCNQALEQLAVLLRLSTDEIKAIALELGYVDDPANPRLKNGALKNAESIMAIVDLADLMRKTGCSAKIIGKWVKQKADNPDGFFRLESSFIDSSRGQMEIGMDNGHVSELLGYKQEVVEEIRNAVKVRCGDAKWGDVAQGIQDRMRVTQSDKLLDLIINCPITVYDSEYYKPTGWVIVPRHIEFDAPEDVYDYLLLDPLINPCMKTTRLKQVISSTQLFIHRILMGLEGAELYGDYTETLERDWEWKKNYRVWEAHKKVLLYPENWIEPELRDDKTPFFEEFEGELSQSELSGETIEKAFLNYLYKVDETGRVAITAFAEHILKNDSGDELGRELHVIGQTREAPYAHFHRKRRFDGVWEPWRKIELDIDSDVVLITIYNGQPYLFWPTLKDKTQKLGMDNEDDPENDKNNYRPYFEIRFNWSCFSNGRWAGRKKTDEYLVWMYDWNYQDLFEHPEKLLRYKIKNDQNTDTLSISLNVMADKTRGTVSCIKCLWDAETVDTFFDDLSSLVNSKIKWIWGSGAGHVFSQSDKEDLVADLNRSIDACKKAVNKRLHLNQASSAAIAIRQLIHKFNHVLFNPYNGLCTYDNTYGETHYNTDTHNYEPIDGLSREDIRSLYELFKDNYLINVIAYHWINNPAITNTWFYRPETQDLNTQHIVSNFFSSVEQTYRYSSFERPELSFNKLVQFAEMTFDGYKLKAEALNGLGNVADIQYNLGDAHFSPSGRYILGDYQTKWMFCNNALEVRYNDNMMFSINVDLNGGSNYFTLFGTNTNPGTVVPEDTDELARFFYFDSRYCYMIDHNWTEQKFYCTEFHHLFVANMIKKHFINWFKTNDDFFDNILGYGTQNNGESLPYAFTDNCRISDAEITIDNETVLRPAFDLTRPYGIYNWEIFFHMPFTIAVRLFQNKKFAEAQKWFHRIFNPLASIISSDDPPEIDGAARYWNLKPLHDLGMPEEVDQDLLDSQEAELAKDPFQPHRIARIRLGAYQRAVVMKYLDNLIAWGDSLFERDTMESINEAAHLYILALKILGKRPIILPKGTAGEQNGVASGGSSHPTVGNLTNYSRDVIVLEAEAVIMEASLGTYSQRMQGLAGAIGQFFSMQWYQGLPPDAVDGEETPSTFSSGLPAFCSPHNEKLLSYWDTVLDRLFKIRNCMNKEGQVRELPIFEPPIDPGLLVRGRALGIDISDLLSDLYAPLPLYRFRVLLQKAYEFCGDVKNLGSALLSALEKKDSEAMSLLRSSHEIQMLKLTETIKKQQIRELRENLKATQISLDMADARYDYYNSMKFENQNEKAQVSKLNMANNYSVASQIASLAASVAYFSPQLHITTGISGATITKEWGGKEAGDALSAMGKFLGMIASIYSHEAHMHEIQGGRERRMDEWKFQAGQSKKEIKQLNKQLLAAEIRINIAERELENHSKQIDQAEEAKAFLESKFTNRELYHWMSSQIATIYFQSYRMAVDLARSAQKAYANELGRDGDDAPNFISSTHWDSLKKGLLAGERLQFDLRRMEQAYLNENRRELELTRHISLKALDPVQLDMLRYTGKCSFSLPELLFDLDHPGHYYRRIRSVSLSIPSVVGPYAGVNCTLTLESSKTRKTAALGEDNLIPDSATGQKQVALSTGRDDSGLFEPNLGDERYLPFELRGAVESVWHLEFPAKYQQFDYSTISDVIFHLRYSARMADNGDFKAGVMENIETAYNALMSGDVQGIALRFDIKREFGDLWHKFTSTGDGAESRELSLSLTPEHFPYLLRPLEKTITHVTLLCELSGEDDVAFIVEPSGSANPVALTGIDQPLADRYYYQSGGIPVSMTASDTITIRPGDDASFTDKLKELVVVVHLTIS